jgi:hypothetical protein
MNRAMSETPSPRPSPRIHLEQILAEAAKLRAKLDDLLDAACKITGEGRENSFTSEAIYDGGFTAYELLDSVIAGRYVRPSRSRP